MSLLRVNEIDVFYGSIQALRGLSIDVHPGEMVALLGANGAGKTTTLRAISGMAPPANGWIAFEGEALQGLPPNRVVGRGISHVPEGRELFPSLSVQENLRLGYWSRRRDRGGYSAMLDRVMGYFPRLRERANQAAGSLSGGEQQMLVMSRALMSSPRLLLADEVSLGLAPMIVSQLFEILREVNRDGTAVLLVEQFVHVALANTHRAYVLSKGRVVLEGLSADLESNPDLLRSYLGEEEAGEPVHAGGNGNGKGAATMEDTERVHVVEPSQDRAGPSPADAPSGAEH